MAAVFMLLSFLGLVFDLSVGSSRDYGIVGKSLATVAVEDTTRGHNVGISVAQ